MATLKASKLALADVYRLLKFEERFDDRAFQDVLSLESVTESEQQQLKQIQTNFRPYLLGKASEGQVRALTTFPLLELAGFYSYPIQINVEEGIDEIEIADEDKIITGRFDIVAVDRARPTVNDVPFWILVIESKEVGVEVRQGLPQLLTYAYGSLKRQPFVWGLTTNGLRYEFVQIEAGNPPAYHLLPDLNLMYTDAAIRLLQVLKAIGKQHFAAT